MEGKSRINLGKIAGLKLSADPSALVTALLLWLLFAVLGLWLLDRSPLAALLGGLGAVILHYASEIWHQLGHATAARSTGHPMVGINLWGPLSSSIYPANEPPLPRSVHMRRALGGPLASLVLTALALIPVLVLAVNSTLWWLALFLFADNLLVFTLGSFLPLGFTDGSTLLRLAQEKRAQ